MSKWEFDPKKCECVYEYGGERGEEMELVIICNYCFEHDQEMRNSIDFDRGD